MATKEHVKPKIDITGIKNTNDLITVLYNNFRELPNDTPRKSLFYELDWTCKTFDEWLDMGRNFFDIVGTYEPDPKYNRYSRDH